MHILRKFLKILASINYPIFFIMLFGLLSGFLISSVGTLTGFLISLIFPALGVLYFLVELAVNSWSMKGMRRGIYFILIAALFNGVVFYRVVFG